MRFVVDIISYYGILIDLIEALTLVHYKVLFIHEVTLNEVCNSNTWVCYEIGQA